MKKRKSLQNSSLARKIFIFQMPWSVLEHLDLTLIELVGATNHIFAHPDIPELINLQNVNGKAKPYQIKQSLKIIEKYKGCLNKFF